MSVHEVALKKAENLEGLKDILPDFAKDIRLNLSAVVKEDGNSGLTLNQVYGTALASAYATRNTARSSRRSQGEVSGTCSRPKKSMPPKAAATIMGMNNVYYRAIHMIEDEELGKMPAGLRMNVLSNPGVDKATFRSCLNWPSPPSTAAADACRPMRAASNMQGLSKAAVQHGLKIAAVISAAAQALSI
jgi:alkyl hydroperoxide reductase subunit D